MTSYRYHFNARLLTSTALCVVLSGVVLVLAAPAALAQSATTLPTVSVPTSGGITSPLSGSTIAGKAVEARRLGSGDTAGLLSGTPGVSLNSAGGISSLPAIHGLASDRVKTLVDGRPITASCPNHMNPPLSYLAPTSVSTINVWAGITPVSVGGDSIGGTIAVESAPPAFAKPGEGIHTEGSLSTVYRSTNRSIETGGRIAAGIENFSIGYSGSMSHAGNYRDGDDKKVTSTAYESRGHAASLAARTDHSLFVVEGGVQFVPYQGFVNQQMDLVENRTEFVNARYEGEFGWGTLDARVFWQDVHHEMNVGDDKLTFPMPMWMPMIVDGTDVGYSLKAELPLSQRDTLRLGNEFHHFQLDDKWPPVDGTAPWMAPLTFASINDGRRDRLGSFAEWEAKWSPEWTTLLGGRVDAVWMDTDDVQGYSGMYAADANAFNARDHARTDVNFDLTALARFEPNAASTYEVGAARKSRSPNLYERFAWSKNWMAAGMINWFGDGNYYVGNPDLKPEVAHTISVSAGWHDAARTEWELKFTPYYTYVQDFIGVDRIGTRTYGKSTFNQLRFANHDAQIFGIDVAGRLAVLNSPQFGRAEVKGVVGWLHGETIDSGDGLYHMMPLNGRLSLEHTLGGWNSAVELHLVDAKTDGDPLRREPNTPAYALVNLRTGYEWQNIRFDVGVDNLFDKKYYLPLGGVNFDDFMASDWSDQIRALAGPGRSFMAGVTVKF